MRASEPFNLKLQAVNAKGDPTLNFGKEIAAENFKLSYVLQAPATVDGMTKNSFGGIANGASSTATPWRFDETGTVQLNVKLDNGSGNYMGNNTAGFDTKGSLNLLFIPDHFDTVLSGAVPMSCAIFLNNPCTANPNGSFVYSRQPFELLVYAYIGLTDSNGNYLAPQNYVGAGAAAITLSAWNAAGGSTPFPTSGANGGDFVWSGEANSATPGRFTFAYDAATKRTVGKLAAANLPSFNFVALAPASAPAGPATPYVRAEDANGATSKRTSAGETALTVVSGRLEVGNNNGLLNTMMPVNLKAQYWNGASYVFNPQFGLRSPATSPVVEFNIGNRISFINCLGFASATSTTCPTFTVFGSDKVQFKNGAGQFRLNRPTPAAAVKGSVGVLMQAPNDGPQWIPYLPSFVPAGRLTFGIAPSGPVIYTREVYN